MLNSSASSKDRFRHQAMINLPKRQVRTPGTPWQTSASAERWSIALNSLLTAVRLVSKISELRRTRRKVLRLFRRTLEELLKHSPELREQNLDKGPMEGERCSYITADEGTLDSQDIFLALPRAVRVLKRVKLGKVDVDKARRPQYCYCKNDRAAKRQLRREQMAANKLGQKKAHTSTKGQTSSNLRRGSRARRPPRHLADYEVG